MASIDQKIEVCGNSPERIYVTDANRNDENVRRHIARYEFAARHIPAGASILDCACGSGYGTEILARRVGWSYVLGADRDHGAISYAQAHHRCRGSYHLLSDIGKLDMEEGSLDAVVSLETMEHVPLEVCREFLASAARWVKPGGIIVASSPMLRYRIVGDPAGGRQDPVPYVTSPHHVNEMPRRELLAILVEVLPLSGWVHNFYHQEQEAFVPLLDEHEGFLVVVARKRVEPRKERT